MLAHRLRTRHGELDLVSRHRDVLSVHEVKTGFVGPRYRPGDRLDAERAQRLGEAARALGRRVGAAAWRVELIEVALEPSGEVDVRCQEVAAGPGEAPTSP